MSTFGSLDVRGFKPNKSDYLGGAFHSEEVMEDSRPWISIKMTENFFWKVLNWTGIILVQLICPQVKKNNLKINLTWGSALAPNTWNYLSNAAEYTHHMDLIIIRKIKKQPITFAITKNCYQTCSLTTESEIHNLLENIIIWSIHLSPQLLTQKNPSLWWVLNWFN